MPNIFTKLPSDADLRRQIHFSTADGRIWLAGQRMLLMHASALGTLRRELIQTVGIDITRRLLLRTGFAAGQRDAALAREVRGKSAIFDMFLVGPQLHMLEGAVQVTPEKFDFDPIAGNFHGIFKWQHSWEAEVHNRDFGKQETPVCWMLLGYASGYTSAFVGKNVLFKESQCEACGSSHCLIEGKPVYEWEDGEAMSKDYNSESLLVHLEDLNAQVQILRSTLQPADELGPLIGQSAAFGKAATLMRKAASTQVTVLLNGETGVGKERFARAIHAMSPRADKPFIAVNCAALPAELIESELFGAEKGAYTGANAARAGRFERADGGTLLLDELGDLPLSAQAKLLRVLEDGVVERLGGSAPRKVNVRIVAATHVHLEEAVKAGKFRQDLLYRLNVYPIKIPPLRERKDDIEALASHMLKKFSTLHDKKVLGITDRALAAMRRYSWPGNVRELENLIERGVILASHGEWVDVDEIFPNYQDENEVGLDANGHLKTNTLASTQELLNSMLQSQTSLDDLEANLIHAAVNQHEGNISAAARSLGITRPQLSYRLQRIEQNNRS